MLFLQAKSLCNNLPAAFKKEASHLRRGHFPKWWQEGYESGYHQVELYSKGRPSPPPPLHHQSTNLEVLWWAFLVNRFESWGALRPKRSSVSLCGQNCNSLWLLSLFYFRFSSTLSTEARISWTILYSPDTNFWSCFSELLFPLPRGKEELRWKSAKALKEDLAGYIGKIKRKPGQLDHGKQRKIPYTKPARTTSQRT